MFKAGLDSPRPVQAGQKQQEARRRSADSAAADGRAEFREMLASLVDPAGLLDTERCGRTAALMEEAASRSGYEAGARMSRILADIFDDAGHIADMPVEDGALDHAFVASERMKEALSGAAEACREGRDAESVGRVEEAGNAVMRLRFMADMYHGTMEVRGESPCAALPESYRKYVGSTCGDAVRDNAEEIRADRARRGVDPAFAPRPKMLEDFLGDADDPNLSAADWLDIIRGKGPPDGYEMVRVDDGDGRQD